MKKALSLVLIMFMLLPLAVSCDNTPKYITVGTTDEAGKLTIVVSANGDDTTADGTSDKPYATIAAASDAIGKVDKSLYTSIDVIVKSGVYYVTSPMTIDEAEGGTESCPVRYIGEDGAVITGSVTLTASDFAPASGDLLQYFPADAQAKIVQIDLTKCGYTAEQISALINGGYYLFNAPALYANGTLQQIVRYPNDSYVQVDSVFDAPDVDKSGVTFAEEHVARVYSWHDQSNVFVHGSFTFLWSQDDCRVVSYGKDHASMILESTNHEPSENGVFYWYNIPEELDVPGEYYVDGNATLYYYPTEDFATSTLTIPVSNGILNVDGDYITLENLKFTGSAGNGITVNADNFAVLGCEISNIAGEYALSATGNAMTLKSNYVNNCRRSAVKVTSGDLEKLITSDTVITDNLVGNYGKAEYPMAFGISANGVGIVVAHNEVFDSNSGGIYWNGAYNIVEYNKVHDVLLASDNIGAIATDGLAQVGNVIRYNYIKNVGAVGELATIEGYGYQGSCAIQGKDNGSYYEAYGNIVNTVNGNGIRMDGRGITVRNNLFIGCANWYVWGTAQQYSAYYKSGDGVPEVEVPDYIYSPVWKDANPDLAQVITDMSQTTFTDPRAWAAPVGNVMENNWVHYDKYVRYFTNWGIAPYSIEDTIYRFSGDTIELDGPGSRENGNHSSYNSRRGDVDIESVLEKAEGFVDMDMERFQRIGIEEINWTLDPALIPTEAVPEE